MGYLTSHIGRGPKRSLKYVRVVKDNRNTIKTLYGRNKIKQALIIQNKLHHIKETKIAVY